MPKRKPVKTRKYLLGRGSYRVFGKSRKEVMRTIGKATRASGVFMGLPRLKVKTAPK